MSTATPEHVAAGRGLLLAYCDEDTLAVADAATVGRDGTGLVVRGRSSLAPRGLEAGVRRLLVSDVGEWTKGTASPRRPMAMPSSNGALLDVTLQTWTRDIVAQGFDDVLTPTLLITAGDDASLRAVLLAGAGAEHPASITLIATEAANLDAEHVEAFLETIGEHGRGQRLAFAFAGPGHPLDKRGRMSAYRRLRAANPGALMLGTDIATGLDVAAHDGAAAIGVSSSLRFPSPVGSGGGGGYSAGFVPGAFLPTLFETRSPTIYMDWYANSDSPVCDECGRAIDSFTPSPADKDRVLAHNIHCFLRIGDELRRRTSVGAREYLAQRRAAALAAHLELRPAGASTDADKSLRWLCELDDPAGRRTTPSGAWI